MKNKIITTNKGCSATKGHAQGMTEMSITVYLSAVGEWSKEETNELT